jgi:uncharacterized short protein YbdD (DUF466 family)
MPSPRRLASARKVVRRFWQGVREWCGDAAYDRYLSSRAQQMSPSKRTLTAEQFYIDQLDRRYSRPNRCC